MDELVSRLSTGEHSVEITIRPERTAERLKQCIDRGYVHIKFTETRGGTELGVRLEKERSNIEGADFAEGSGQITLCGTLKLNYVPVRCVAQIDVKTFAGKGHLEVLPEVVPQTAEAVSA
jgi:hypothetical protein